MKRYKKPKKKKEKTIWFFPGNSRFLYILVDEPILISKRDGLYHYRYQPIACQDRDNINFIGAIHSGSYWKEHDWRKADKADIARMKIWDPDFKPK